MLARHQVACDGPAEECVGQGPRRGGWALSTGGGGRGCLHEVGPAIPAGEALGDDLAAVAEVGGALGAVDVRGVAVEVLVCWGFDGGVGRGCGGCWAAGEGV